MQQQSQRRKYDERNAKKNRTKTEREREKKNQRNQIKWMNRKMFKMKTRHEHWNINRNEWEIYICLAWNWCGLLIYLVGEKRKRKSVSVFFVFHFSFSSEFYNNVKVRHLSAYAIFRFSSYSIFNCSSSFSFSFCHFGFPFLFSYPSLHVSSALSACSVVAFTFCKNYIFNDWNIRGFFIFYSWLNACIQCGKRNGGAAAAVCVNFGFNHCAIRVVRIKLNYKIHSIERNA